MTLKWLIEAEIAEEEAADEAGEADEAEGS